MYVLFIVDPDQSLDSYFWQLILITVLFNGNTTIQSEWMGTLTTELKL